MASVGAGNRIFISYRREDASDIAGRIHDWLSQRLPQGEVFMDVTAIQLGADFVQVIDQAIRQCRAMIIVISPSWLAEINAPTSYVRAEVEAALRFPHLLVLPVLVGGATMPIAAQLPPGLQMLARRNAGVVRSGRGFEPDMQDVGAALGLAVTRPPLPSSPPAQPVYVPMPLAPAQYQPPPYPNPQPPYPYQPPPGKKGASASSRSAITIGIVIVLIVSVAVAVVGLRPGGFLNPNSLTGTWYGSLTVNGVGGPPTFAVYGDLQQSGSTLTGTGQICYKYGSSTETVGNISLSGSVDGSTYTVTFTLPSTSGSPGATFTFTGNYSLSGGTASGRGTGQVSSTNFTLSFKSGSLNDFQAACAQG
jgi:hypothetical protein